MEQGFYRTDRDLEYKLAHFSMLPGSLSENRVPASGIKSGEDPHAKY